MKKAAIVFIFLFTTFFAPNYVNAQTTLPSNANPNSVKSSVLSGENYASKTGVIRAATQEGIIKRLEGVKLSACQQRVSAINNKAENLQTRISNMTTTFNNVATRVDEYYKTKLVPAGKTVTNYDSLIASVSANKAAVDLMSSQIGTQIRAFSCTGDNPAEDIRTYTGNIMEIQNSLKTYKDSVVSLIVAVKSVSGGAIQNTSSQSAMPVIR